MRAHPFVWNRAGLLPDVTQRHYANLRAARERAQLVVGARDWFSVKNQGGVADILIYDEIGYFGVTASDFVSQLNELNVSTINLGINSPGGDAWDGIAIYNGLRAHPATVNVTVDGIAASAASVIAMAGNNIVMRMASRMMIHDAAGLAMGNADDMREMAELLDALSNDIASTYAARAGGDVEQWRERMRATTWYGAEEAVKAKLADSLDTGGTPTDRTVRQFDLSFFRRPDRDGQDQQRIDARTQPSGPSVTPVVSVTADSAPVRTPEPPVHPDDMLFEWDGDLADAFREVMAQHANNMPAPPQSIVDPASSTPEPDPEDFWAISPEEFYNALRGGLTA